MPSTVTPQSKKEERIVKSIESFIDTIETRTSVEEIMEAFATVVKLAQEIQAFTEEEVSRLNSLSEQVISELKALNEQSLTQSSEQLEKKIQKQLTELSNAVKDKLANIKDGYTPQKGVDYFDGESPSVDDIIPYVLEELGELPKTEEIVEEVTKNGEAVRDALELLQGEDRLDVSAIRGLEELIKKHASGKTMVVPNGGASGGKIVKVHDLSGDLDGSTKTFSLPAFYRILTVDLSSFPNALRPTVDYTSDGAAMTITFTSQIDAATMLATGQTCIITYAEI